MAENKVKNLIEEILGSVKQMVLCTSKSNKPWSATVLFVADKDLNIYFFSTPNRRHSKEISENTFVSGAIYREHTKGLAEQSHRGIQFEGECRLVKTAEVRDAYELFQNRFPEIVKFHEMKNATKEMYKIKVKNFVLFDTLNFKANPRQELVWSGKRSIPDL